jgi:hypothetical protein
MKDEHLISYKLFCQRRKFNLHNFLVNNEVLSYEDLKVYFRNKNVTPPEHELYLNIMNIINLNKKEENIDKEKIIANDSVDNPPPKRKKRKPRKKNEQNRKN